jgi:hypothetical protein
MDTAAFLQRALSALSMPTLYLLGKGGYTHDEAQTPSAIAQPGRPVDVAQEFKLMRVQRPEVYAAYEAVRVQLGLTLAELPAQACDCSGFVCWALGVPRDGLPLTPLPEGWINTDSIYADALHAQRLFKAVDQASPGVLVVYPKPEVPRGKVGPPGHIGIVTEVAADGSVTRVLHCAPDNFPLPPPAGQPRNAIAQTGPAHFAADPRSRYVVWRGFEAAA